MRRTPATDGMLPTTQAIKNPVGGDDPETFRRMKHLGTLGFWSILDLNGRFELTMARTGDSGASQATQTFRRLRFRASEVHFHVQLWPLASYNKPKWLSARI